MTLFEEKLFQLNEEELFGKPKSLAVEGSEFMKNFGTIGNITKEVIDSLASKDYILYEDANYLQQEEMKLIKQLGDILSRIEKY